MTKKFTMDDLPAEFKLCFRILDAVVVNLQEYMKRECSIETLHRLVSTHVQTVEKHRTESERSLAISRVIQNGHYMMKTILRGWHNDPAAIGLLRGSSRTPQALEAAISLAKLLFTKAYIDGGGSLPSDNAIRLCVIHAVLVHMTKALPLHLTEQFKEEIVGLPGVDAVQTMQMTHLHSSSIYVQRGSIMTLENTSAGLVDLQTMIDELKRSMIDRAYAASGVRVVVSSKGKK